MLLEVADPKSLDLLVYISCAFWGWFSSPNWIKTPGRGAKNGDFDFYGILRENKRTSISLSQEGIP